ncbi:MAG: ABC transporter permease subunit, partial [Planctomycetota bacterium]|nr:ABC transporter permease subunit [Planctomycetota bacterium]
MIRLSGPVLVRELVTTLRSPKAFAILLGFNACMAAAVLLGWRWAHETPLARADIGRRVFLILSMAQLILVTLLAPALSSGAITLERERDTLDLLRTTPIGARRLLLEKYLASVVFFILLLLTSTPLTALSILLGGIRPSAVLGATVALLVLVLACGAVGVTASVMFRHTQASLAVTYLIMIPVGALIAAAFYIGEAAQNHLSTVVLGFLGAGIGLALWKASQRILETREESEIESDSFEDVAVHAGMILDRRVFPDSIVWPARRNAPIPDGVNPVFEKDLRLEAPGRSGRMISILLQGGMLLSLPLLFLPPFILPELLPSDVDALAGQEPQMIIYPLFLLGFVLLCASAFSATAFSAERERKTLDSLALTPLPARAVVWAKALASLRGTLGITFLIAFPFFFYILMRPLGFAGRASWAIGLILQFGILILTGVAITFLAIWISIRSRTSLRAMLTLYISLAIFVVLPIIAIRLIGP